MPSILGKSGTHYVAMVTKSLRQDKTTLFNQGSPISCKAGILRGPGFNKTTYTHLQ